MIFGITFITTKRLRELEKKERQIQTLVQIHRWFSGWRDLDIIWDYIFAETYFGSISSCRSDYAKARGTNAYGEVIK